MKHYFLTAKSVGDLTAILCAALEESRPSRRRRSAACSPGCGRRRSRAASSVSISSSATAASMLPTKTSSASDPVNLIRFFRLRRQNDLALHPDAMRLVTRSLKLIDAKLRESEEANRIFLEILTCPNAPEIVAAAHERGRRSGPIHPGVRPRRRDDAVQHVSPLHGGRAPVALHRRAGGHRTRRACANTPLANEIISTINPSTARCSMSRCSCTTSPRAGPRITRIAGARIARALCPRLGLSPAETETVGVADRKPSRDGNIAQTRDLSDRKTIENFAAVVQSLERLKLLTDPDRRRTFAPSARVYGTDGRRNCCARFTTKPSRCSPAAIPQVNREKRVAFAQAELRAALTDWRPDEIDAYIARHYPPTGCKTDLAASSNRRSCCAAPRRASKRRWLRGSGSTPARRHRTHGAGARPSVAAVDHRRRLRGERCQHRRCADLHDDATDWRSTRSR